MGIKICKVCRDQYDPIALPYGVGEHGLCQYCEMTEVVGACDNDGVEDCVDFINRNNRAKENDMLSYEQFENMPGVG